MLPGRAFHRWANADGSARRRQQRLGKAWASEPNDTWFYFQGSRGQGDWTSLGLRVLAVEMEPAASLPQAAVRVTDVAV